MGTRRVLRWRRLSATALAALLALAAPAACAQEPWHAPAMPYRLQLDVAGAARRGGIDTALVNLAEQSELCRPDGADVCVTTRSGAAVPHRIEVRRDATFDVFFRVPEDCDRFHLYYGSGQAQPQTEEWAESAGGLFLETRPIRQPVRRAADLPGAVRRNSGRFDRKPWAQIWDMENPFGRDDLYLSIYEGTLYCPERGRYVFAVNSDDAAFFAIEGVASPLCWREGGVPSTTWRDPSHPRAVREAMLERGVYGIRYCHVENYGAQLAKLGWQTPSSDAIVAVPPDAFVRYLPAEIAARELREGSLSPFFVARHCYTLKVNGMEPGFPRYRFERRMAAPAGGTDAQYRWDFGDGATAVGPEVEHEFPTMGTHTVALTVSDSEGPQASVRRPITARPWPTRDVVLRLQTRPAAPFVPAGVPLRLRTLVFTRGGAEQQFELAATVSREGGLDGGGLASSRPLGVVAGAPGESEKWTELDEVFDVEGGEVRIAVSARLHGVEVAREELTISGTDGVLGDLRLDSAQDLRRGDGSLVALRVADATRPGASPRCLCEPGSAAVNVLAVDEALGGPAGSPTGSYADHLADALGGRYAGLTFELRRSCVAEGEGWSPMPAFLHVAAALGRARPNVVLLVCQPESVINGVPIGEFEQGLTASLDQVLVRSRAEAIVVTPPPLPGSPEAAREYARAAKRVGLRKGVPVVDLYSRFLLVPDWEALFQPAGGGGRTFLLYPNERGQELIAREILATIVQSLHEGLSAAVRQASFLRSQGGV